MANSGLASPGLADGFEDGSFDAQKPTALSNKVTSILSTPLADPELGEALRIFDERSIRNAPETRRRLRLDVQKELIDCNGDIVRNFGHVAEVRLLAAITLGSRLKLQHSN
jgi:conserved oligomeric Golgi complex subunit 6